MRLTALTATILACLASPAGAPLLCPDETGEYTPDACDLIWPFEPNPNRVECDMIDLFNGEADPVCMEYWKRERARERELLRLLGFEEVRWLR